MTSEEFFTVWADTELRQYIVDQAKRRTKRKDIQEEYVQEAWLIISTAPAGYDTDCYKKLAEKAIYSSWWQNRKENMLFYSMEQHRENASRKTPERATDNDSWFMKDRVKNNDWRN